MQAAIPEDERGRLATLRSFHILDTMPEQSFDDVTLLASQICGTPISAISLVDEQRQWFKSIVGLDVRETHRDAAFCSHAILEPGHVLVVPDATKDARFADNVLVVGDPKIRFYAGTPLVTFAGDALGSLCVIDRTPRELHAGQLEALRVLGRQVVYQLELRRAFEELRHTVGALRQAETDLRSEQRNQLELRDQLVSHVSHELRSPLTVIYQYVSILLDGLAGSISGQQREFLDIALKNALQLQRMIGDLIDSTRAGTGKLALDRCRIGLGHIATEVTASLAMVASAKRIRLHADVAEALPEAVGDPGRLRQVIVNLVENAIKFTPEGGTVTVRARVDAGDPAAVRLSVEDTGCGIAPTEQERIFDRLYQVNDCSNRSRKGLGLGLYICRELVLRQGGRLWVEGGPGEGSRFHFTVPVFDLATLLAPVLSGKNLERGTLAVVRVHVSPQADQEITQTGASPVGAAWQTVKACTNPSMDVVLPRLGEDDRSETIVVVAIADEAGAGILASRIKEQLTATEEIGRNGYVWEVTTTLLSLPHGRGNYRNAEVAQTVAGMIDPHLENTSWKRAA